MPGGAPSTSCSPDLLDPQLLCRPGDFAAFPDKDLPTGTSPNRAAITPRQNNMGDAQSAYSYLLSAVPPDVASAIIAQKPIPGGASQSINAADSAKIQSAVNVVLGALPTGVSSSLVALSGIPMTASVSVVTASGSTFTVINGETSITSGPSQTDHPTQTASTSLTPPASSTGPAYLSGGSGPGSGGLQGGQIGGIVGGLAGAAFLLTIGLLLWRRSHQKKVEQDQAKGLGEKAYPEVAWLYDPRRSPSNHSRHNDAPEVSAPLMSGGNGSTAYQPHPISGPGTSFHPSPAMSGTQTPNNFYPSGATTAQRSNTQRSYAQYQPVNNAYNQSYGTNDYYNPGAAGPSGGAAVYDMDRSRSAASRGSYSAIPPIPTLSNTPEDEDDYEDEDEHAQYHDALASMILPHQSNPQSAQNAYYGRDGQVTYPAPTNTTHPENPFTDEQFEVNSAAIARVISMSGRGASNDYGTPLMTITEEGANGNGNGASHSAVSPMVSRTTPRQVYSRSNPNLHGSAASPASPWSVFGHAEGPMVVGASESDLAPAIAVATHNASLPGAYSPEASRRGSASEHERAAAGSNHNGSEQSLGLGVSSISESNSGPSSGQPSSSSVFLPAKASPESGGSGSGASGNGNGAGHAQPPQQQLHPGQTREERGSYGFGQANANLSPVSGRSVRE